MADEPPKGPATPSTMTSMPAQPATTKLQAQTDRVLLEDLYRLTKSSADDIRIIRADQDLLMGNVESLKVDVRELQRWKLDSEDRQSKHSGGFRQLSDSDHKQDAAIASIVTKVTGLEKSQEAQTTEIAATKALVLAGNADTADLKKELVDGVKSFWKRHPKLETAFVGLLLAVFALATAAIAGRLHQ